MAEQPWEVWRERAREYRDAARTCPPGYPKTFLHLHSVELLLKSEVLRQGTAVSELINTHDFARLLAAVGLAPEPLGHLIAADPKMTYFRYPKPPRAGLDLDRIEDEANTQWAALREMP
ncbi:MAG: hypothetical protein LC104_00795 [Bacteroidales bacterium]|nr:hypothetical protein [Bacteroidales bacterium]